MRECVDRSCRPLGAGQRGQGGSRGAQTPERGRRRRQAEERGQVALHPPGHGRRAFRRCRGRGKWRPPRLRAAGGGAAPAPGLLLDRRRRPPDVGQPRHQGQGAAAQGQKSIAIYKTISSISRSFTQHHPQNSSPPRCASPRAVRSGARRRATFSWSCPRHAFVRGLYGRDTVMPLSSYVLFQF